MFPEETILCQFTTKVDGLEVVESKIAALVQKFKQCQELMNECNQMFQDLMGIDITARISLSNDSENPVQESADFSGKSSDA